MIWVPLAQDLAPATSKLRYSFTSQTLALALILHTLNLNPLSSSKKLEHHWQWWYIPARFSCRSRGKLWQWNSFSSGYKGLAAFLNVIRTWDVRNFKCRYWRLIRLGVHLPVLSLGNLSYCGSDFCSEADVSQVWTYVWCDNGFKPQPGAPNFQGILRWLADTSNSECTRLNSLSSPNIWWSNLNSFLSQSTEPPISSGHILENILKSFHNQQALSKPADATCHPALSIPQRPSRWPSFPLQFLFHLIMKGIFSKIQTQLWSAQCWSSG